MGIKKPINPKLIPFISAPFYIFGIFLAALNWQRLGRPEKARSTIKWGIIGLVLLIIIASYFPLQLLKEMWFIGVGINIGTGMALKTLQTIECSKGVERPE
ncbi:hypothetical protein [Phosphitispora sp. TUW77]|uniref:hypothetical protein n=1 Tax=Phosphitispora sp. TUW77 TaxID=3152361 RepID=UPI003AB573DD